MHLFEGQGRIILNHILRRHSFAEQLDERIKSDSTVPDPICAFDDPYVILQSPRIVSIRIIVAAFF